MIHKALTLWTGFFGLLVALLVLTGGTHFGKFEVSSVDPWAWAFALGLFISLKYGRKNPPIWELFENQLIPKLLTRPNLRQVLCIAGGLILILSSLHGLRFWAGKTHAFDLTFLHQPLFHPFLSGKILHCDLCNGLTYFGEHISPSLLLLTPWTVFFKQFWFRDLSVFLLQAALLTLPVALWMRKSSLGFFLGVLLLCHRAYRGVFVWDFREDVLAFTALSGVCWALLNRKWIIGALCLVVALGCKENVGLASLGLLFPIFLDPELGLSRTERAWAGTLITAVCLGWTAFVFGVWMPSLSAGTQQSHEITVRLRGLGANPSEILTALLLHPWDALQLLAPMVLHKSAIKYLVLLLAPWAFFWKTRSSLSWALGGSLGIAMNLVSQAETQRSLQFHYELLILPFLMVATLRGLEALRSRSHRTLALGLLCALSFSGRWPGAVLQNYARSAWHAGSAPLELLRLPATPEPVCASLETLAFLSHLPNLRALSQAYAPEVYALQGTALQLELRKEPAMDLSEVPGHNARECTRAVYAKKADLQK